MNRLVVAVCACCFALVVAACGDSGEMKSAEYFAELEAAAITFAEGRDAMMARVDASEDRIEGTREYYTGGLAAFEPLMSEVESLRPPPEVSEIHDRFLANGRALVSATESVLEELEGVDTMSLLSVFENSAAVTTFVSANDAAIESCVELTQAAADSGITVDLRCPS